VIASVGTPLLHGRAAFERRAWASAFAQLSAADRVAALRPDDLERLAVAAYLSGNDRECESIFTRAYHDFVEHGEIARAVRSAFSLGMFLFDRGQSAPGSGWIARGRRLLADHGCDSVERGYLMMPDALAKTTFCATSGAGGAATDERDGLAIMHAGALMTATPNNPPSAAR